MMARKATELPAPAVQSRRQAKPTVWRGEAKGALGHEEATSYHHLCLFLALGYPHPPYAADEPRFSMIDRTRVAPPAPVPENRELEPALYAEMREVLGMQNWTSERWAELRATYLASCAQVDHQYGMLMQALRDAGRYDDSAVFCFADHGDFTGDYGVVQKADNVFDEFYDLECDPYEVRGSCKTLSVMHTGCRLRRTGCHPVPQTESMKVQERFRVSGRPRFCKSLIWFFFNREP